MPAVLDEANGQLRHVNADPVAAESLGGVNRRVTAASQVEHHVAGLRLAWIIRSSNATGFSVGPANLSSFAFEIRQAVLLEFVE